MAQLFVSRTDAPYALIALDSGVLDLCGVLDPNSAAAAAVEPHAHSNDSALVSFGPACAERWAVLAGAGERVFVNGLPIQSLGICVLAHRDEVHVPGWGSGFFSAEKLPSIVPFPIADREVLCGRCRRAIKPGAPAVKCVGCGVWYDQSQELPCFDYSPTCTYCQAATVLGGEFLWTPDEV